MKIQDILKSKGSHVECIESHNTVREALARIVARKIGALLVVEDDTAVGIITERDILRLVAVCEKEPLSGQVKDFMTRNLVIGLPDDDLDTAMACMTINRFRHLPIIEGQKVIGIVSIGDIVKAQVHNLKTENRYLFDYITGKYPG